MFMVLLSVLSVVWLGGLMILATYTTQERPTNPWVASALTNMWFAAAAPLVLAWVIVSVRWASVHTSWL